jgi:hypothetical protein
LNKSIFLKKKFIKTYLNRYQSNYITNASYNIPKNNFDIFFKSSFFKLTNLLYTLFTNNKNVVFVDYNYNYNYLPILNLNIFNRSSKYLQKLLTYFNVGAVIFLNLNNKKFIVKKIHKIGLINISLDLKLFNKNFDLYVNIPNTPLTHYLIYVYILNLYIKTKSNNLNTNGAALFFFKPTYIHY